MNKKWIASLGAIVVAACLVAGCNREPFSYVKVKGKICYEDGSLIPAKRIVLKFISLTPGPNSATNPPQGNAEVDTKTGEFDIVSSHKYGDGVVPGDHKVLVLGDTSGLVPREYTDLANTPLSVNTNDSPFLLKIYKQAER